MARSVSHWMRGNIDSEVAIGTKSNTFKVMLTQKNVHGIPLLGEKKSSRSLQLKYVMQDKIKLDSNKCFTESFFPFFSR